MQQDSSGYPDCRPEFYQAFNEAIRTGTKDGAIRIETPLIGLRKSEIVTLGLELGAPFDLTWSCYSRVDQACGVCESCVLRLRAFASGGRSRSDSVPFAGPMQEVDYAPPKQEVKARARELLRVSSAPEAYIMKRFLTVLTLFAMLTSLCAVQVFAQATGTIKGFAKDENGKPITDATVELDNIENGAKQTLKVNSKGEYFSAGIAAGTYNAILIDKDGKRIDAFGKVPIAAGQETTVNFDLKKDKAGGPTPEELKKIEEAKASNENIKNLNVILAQARDLEKAGNYDQAIAMLQPAAEKNPTAGPVMGATWAMPIRAPRNIPRRLRPTTRPSRLSRTTVATSAVWRTPTPSQVKMTRRSSSTTPPPRPSPPTLPCTSLMKAPFLPTRSTRRRRLRHSTNPSRQIRTGLKPTTTKAKT